MTAAISCRIGEAWLLSTARLFIRVMGARASVAYDADDERREIKTRRHLVARRKHENSIRYMRRRGRRGF